MSNIRFLKTFLVVTQEGSFALAAERVALTQAAVGLTNARTGNGAEYGVV